jgi:dTDP-glucose pyrophosphorylase
MWGIIPAAGMGSRIQPLAFSKELLPVGSRRAEGREQPKAVSEYLIERMVAAGADRICFVIGPGKTDIISYFGAEYAGARIAYVVQPQPQGLCDAIFRASPFIEPGDGVLVGLPDTVWFPEDGFARLPAAGLSFLLFRVGQPQLFDAVVTDTAGAVQRIEVKQASPATPWVWGAFRLDGALLRELQALWEARHGADEYFGTLVNAWLAAGGSARGVPAGHAYVDVGTLNGYRAALSLLGIGPPTPAAIGSDAHA